MRLIGQLDDDQQAKRLAAYMRSRGIAVECETNRIWVIDEDRVEEASTLYRTFLEDPERPEFLEALAREERADLVEAKQEEAPPPRRRRRGPPMGKATLIVMAVCAVLVIWAELTSPKRPEEPSGEPFLEAPLLLTLPYRALLFDYPKPWDIAYELSRDYSLEQLQHPSSLPPKVGAQVVEARSEPIFKGIYGWLVGKGWGPMFVKIGEGQVWRLFTPALLHAGLLHLFINLLWMIILGNQVEYRLGVLRYLLFILISGVVSNVAQYLVSGPAFLGLSGVVVALFGFVWMRTSRAPWEGYQLGRPTIVFVNIFIFGMVALELASFALQLMGRPPLFLGIANTAHLAGLAVGVWFGRTNLFSYQTS